MERGLVNEQGKRISDFSETDWVYLHEDNFCNISETDQVYLHDEQSGLDREG